MSDTLSIAEVLEACDRYESVVTDEQREEGRKLLNKMVEEFNAEWDDREKRLSFTSEDLNMIYNL